MPEPRPPQPPKPPQRPRPPQRPQPRRPHVTTAHEAPAIPTASQAPTIPAAPAEPAAAAEPKENAGWVCIACGYSLQTLHREQACPECGTPVHDSLQAGPVRVDAALLRRLRAALNAWLVATLMIPTSPIWAVALIAVGGVIDRTLAWNLLMLSPLIPLGLWALGTGLISSGHPLTQNTDTLRWRMPALASSAAAVVLALAAYYLALIPTPVPLLTPALNRALPAWLAVAALAALGGSLWATGAWFDRIERSLAQTLSLQALPYPLTPILRCAAAPPTLGAAVLATTTALGVHPGSRTPTLTCAIALPAMLLIVGLVLSGFGALHTLKLLQQIESPGRGRGRGPGLGPGRERGSTPRPEPTDARPRDLQSPHA